MRIGSLKRWWMHYSFWCEKQVFIFYIALIMCNFWGNLMLGHNFEFICNFFWHQDNRYLFLKLILGTKRAKMMDLFWVKLYIVPRPRLKALIQDKVQKKFVNLFLVQKSCYNILLCGRCSNSIGIAFEKSFRYLK